MGSGRCGLRVEWVGGWGSGVCSCGLQLQHCMIHNTIVVLLALCCSYGGGLEGRGGEGEGGERRGGGGEILQLSYNYCEQGTSLVMMYTLSIHKIEHHLRLS